MSLKRFFDIIIDKCNILSKSDQPEAEMQKIKPSSSKKSDNDEPTSSSYRPPLTRSRSASASGTSSRSNSSGSSSSGSSSSGSGSSSSGSSSSGSGSSSSSDTEASQHSRASQRSRASRSSQKSTGSIKKGNQQSKDNGVSLKHPVASPRSPKSQPKKAPVPGPSKVTSASATSSSAAQKKRAQSQEQTKANSTIKPKPKPKPVLSGSVTNEKTISLSSSTPLLLKAKPTSTTQVITSSTTNKKKEVKKPPEKRAASSTESESEGKPLAALKRANITPKPSKQQPSSSKANGKAAPSSIKKAAVLAVKKKALPSTAAEKKKLPTTTTRKKGLCLKTIFSPDNSSADEEVLGGDKKKKLTKKMAPDAQKVTALLKKKIRAAAVAASDSNAAAMYSSSISATSSSIGSTSTSATDSSSEEEPEKPSKNVDAASPKSSTGSRGSRKGRPITRRQRGTVKSKTIPTTTVFSHIQSSGVTTSNQHQQMIIQSQSPFITRAWGDSDFSDDPSQGAALVRCPTKSSTNKAMRYPAMGSGGEEELMERKCPYPACDSQGHLSGKFPSHSLLSTCPKYHDLTQEECKENADERAKRDSERKKYFNASQPHLKKPPKLSHEAKVWLSQMKELKEQQCKRPVGTCSEYDQSLWSDALANAARRIELEQSESISLRSVVIGRYEMACWCESPYAEPLCHSRRIFVCEFCLKPLPSGTVLRRHCAKCVWRHPPGDEIYRKDRLSVWEVDGKSQKGYCQNLCLLAKSFLDHKTLYLDVDPFLFYVMTLADGKGCHVVGYFSKEKNSFLNYNVSCILTLPPYQRQGFGRLLIDFSYLLTRVEGKVGSPEKPLSDLGLISYRSYWKDAVLRRMCACATREMNVKDLSIELGVTSADLISTLQFLGMLKYWKGKHLVLKKQDVLEEYLERVRRRGETRQIEPSCLRWRPYQPPVDQSSS